MSMSLFDQVVNDINRILVRGESYVDARYAQFPYDASDAEQEIYDIDTVLQARHLMVGALGDLEDTVSEMHYWCQISDTQNRAATIDAAIMLVHDVRKTLMFPADVDLTGLSGRDLALSTTRDVDLPVEFVVAQGLRNHLMHARQHLSLIHI